MTLNFAGKLVDASQILVMGIINLNHDSFFPGSRARKESDLLHKVEQQLAEGADIIDLGFMSSRPGAKVSDPGEEAENIGKAIDVVLQHFPDTILSVDTLHSSVAEHSIALGARMINDISAGTYDAKMLSTVSKYKVPYCIMHMKGLPENMQEDTTYEDVVLDVVYYLAERKKAAREAGIIDVVVDPGFGFGKSIDQNYELLNKLKFCNTLDAPVLVGLSRKSMIYKYLDISPEEALNATTALHMMALQNGAHILRVHDVRPAKECIKMFKKYSNPLTKP